MPTRFYAHELTALMWAAGYGKTDTVQALLAAGAKPELKDDRGKTALDIAREGNFPDTVKLLEAALEQLTPVASVAQVRRRALGAARSRSLAGRPHPPEQPSRQATHCLIDRRRDVQRRCAPISTQLLTRWTTLQASLSASLAPAHDGQHPAEELHRIAADRRAEIAATRG